MARNYGNKRSSRRSSNVPQQLIIIVVTFLFGYLTASVLDIQTVSHWMNSQVLASHEAKQQQPEKVAPAHAQIPPKPKFEFYTLLANEKKGPGSAAQTTNPQAAANQTAPSTAVVSAATTTSHVAVNNGNPQHPAPVKVATAKPVATANGSKGTYLVQVASFKTRQDAEHMKASLTLKGFEVNVVAVSQAQGNWFRVVLGPYSNRELAQKVQVSLAKTERLNGMVRNAGG